MKKIKCNHQKKKNPRETKPKLDLSHPEMKPPVLIIGDI